MTGTEKMSAKDFVAMQSAGKPKALRSAQGKKQSQQEALRKLFEGTLAQLWPNHPKPEREFLYALPRRFKADYAFVSSRLLVEVEGGIGSGMGHGGHISGLLMDLERSRHASANGWRVFRVSRIDLRDEPQETIALLRRAVEEVK